MPYERKISRKEKFPFWFFFVCAAGVCSISTGVSVVTNSLLHTNIHVEPTILPPLLNHDIIQEYASDFGTYSKHQRTGRAYLTHRMTREHSFPLITGDGFRMIADLIIDDRTDTPVEYIFNWQSKLACESVGNNLNLELGQAVVLFVAIPLVNEFFSSSCFESIRVPIVVITHNGDDDMPSDTNARYLDHPNLVHWFAQNCDRVHAKLTCIPIGIENRHWGPPSNDGSHGSMPELLLGMMVTRSHSYSAAQLALSALTQKNIQHTWAYFPRVTHVSRSDLKAGLEKAGTEWVRASGAPNGGHYFVTDYYRTILQHVAIACPRGNGRDSHRAWESLYLGRVIITLHSPANKLWEDLPVLILDNWDKLPGMGKNILDSAIKFSFPSTIISVHKLFMPHWICLIGIAGNRSKEFCGREAIINILEKGV